MNNEQKQYILRKPVTILHELDYSLELNLGEYMMPVDKDCFKDEFVPLSVSGLTRQVEDEIDYVMEKAIMNHITSEAIDADGSEMHESIKDQAVKAIVLLLLNQEKETK